MEKLLTIDTVCYMPSKLEIQHYMSGMAMQTNKTSWFCRVWHDGPTTNEIRNWMNEYVNEFPHMFEFIETPQRKNRWGHNMRAQGLAECNTKLWKSDNLDNSCCPRMIEICLAEWGWLEYQNIDIDILLFPISHSYQNVNGRNDCPYSVLEVDLACNRLDACCFIAKTSSAQQIGWGEELSWEDGIFANRMRDAGMKKHIIKSVLAFHN